MLVFNSGDYSVCSNLTEVYYKCGDETNALLYINIGVDKGNYNSVLQLGLYYKHEKKYQKMIEIFERCLITGFCYTSTKQLAIYYNSINNTEMELKYYLLGADENSINLLKDLNVFLTNTNNLEYFIKAKKHLDNENKLRYEKLLCDSIRLMVS